MKKSSAPSPPKKSHATQMVPCSEREGALASLFLLLCSLPPASQAWLSVHAQFPPKE